MSRPHPVSDRYGTESCQQSISSGAERTHLTDTGDLGDLGPRRIQPGPATSTSTATATAPATTCLRLTRPPRPTTGRAPCHRPSSAPPDIPTRSHPSAASLGSPAPRRGPTPGRGSGRLGQREPQGATLGPTCPPWHPSARRPPNTHAAQLLKKTLRPGIQPLATSHGSIYCVAARAVSPTIWRVAAAGEFFWTVGRLLRRLSPSLPLLLLPYCCVATVTPCSGTTTTAAVLTVRQRADLS